MKIFQVLKAFFSGFLRLKIQVLHVFSYDSGTEMWVAFDLADLFDQIYREEKRSFDDYLIDNWEQVPDETEIEISEEDPTLVRTTKKARTWALEQGRGFLCSTEW